jgi:biopolymer transport protein ExbB/TolQ
MMMMMMMMMMMVPSAFLRIAARFGVLTALLIWAANRASTDKLKTMETAVERVREFIAGAQTRAAALDQDLAALEAFITERAADSPETRARRELVRGPLCFADRMCVCVCVCVCVRERE